MSVSSTASAAETIPESALKRLQRNDGEERFRKYETLIREHKVEENVFLLGTQTNPYGYMRACDIYVQPSYTEGYSTTICEAY